jgi:hypothetical protein
MRRWIFIVVMCLLPLQSAWAAAHLCDASAEHATQHGKVLKLNKHADAHEPAEPSADTCGDLHCHALHAPALPGAPASLVLSGALAVPAGPPDDPRSWVASEIDRPNWRLPA